MLDVRLAPPVSAMQAFVEPYRDWIESVLGCPMPESVTFETEVPFGQLVAEDLLADASLDRGCLKEAEPLRPLVSRWATPPGASPRITLEPSRNRQGLLTAAEPAWDPHWKDTPGALWFHKLNHAIVAIDIPYVSFKFGGPASNWQSWLLVNRAELGAALNLLRGILLESRKGVHVIGGKSIPLPEAGYDWDRVVLDPDLTGLVREDFETFLQREAWFRRHRLPFRRGYLFYGPPGNGKTSAIRVMTLHPAMSSYSLDFSNEDLGNEALTDLFGAAARNAPSLVIFEDLDRLYGKAGGASWRHWWPAEGALRGRTGRRAAGGAPWPCCTAPPGRSAGPRSAP